MTDDQIIRCPHCNSTVKAVESETEMCIRFYEGKPILMDCRGCSRRYECDIDLSGKNRMMREIPVGDQ